MKYQEYLKVIDAMPKICPAIKITVICEDYACDKWAVSIACRGVDKYGASIQINEYTECPHKLSGLLSDINLWAKTNLAIMPHPVSRNDVTI